MQHSHEDTHWALARASFVHMYLFIDGNSLKLNASECRMFILRFQTNFDGASTYMLSRRNTNLMCTKQKRHDMHSICLKQHPNWIPPLPFALSSGIAFLWPSYVVRCFLYYQDGVLLFCQTFKAISNSTYVNALTCVCVCMRKCFCAWSHHNRNFLVFNWIYLISNGFSMNWPFWWIWSTRIQYFMFIVNIRFYVDCTHFKLTPRQLPCFCLTLNWTHSFHLNCDVFTS